MPKIKNVDQYQITWDNDNFYVDIMDLFGKGTRFIFPPEDIEALRDSFTEALRRYHRGETSGD